MREFNREDWADKPFLIRLVGGLSDGKTFRWHSRPETWNEPLPPPPLVEFAHLPDLDAMLGTDSYLTPNMTYWRTGSVADDGAHLYEFKGTS